MRECIDGGQLNFLTNQEVQQLHLGVLEIMERVGVKVEHSGALKILKDAGAEVNFERKVAKVPEYIVEEAIKKTPKNVTFYGRDEKESFSVKGGRGVYFGPCAGNPYFIDENGLRRMGKLSDMEKNARIADALPEVDFVMGLTTASDVPPSALDLYEQFAVMSNTKKHVQVFVYNGGVKMTQAQIELASLFAGGEEELISKPIVTFYIEPLSPLYVGEGYVDALIECAKLKIPMIFAPVPVAGATSPVTLAGSAIQGVVESLIGPIIAQLINPGTPFVLGPVSTTMEMKKGMSIYSNPESILMRAAMAQLFRHYKLPSWGTGGVTDSKILDEQSTAEAALTLLASALSGNNLIHDLAYVESAKSGSIALLAIENELISAIRRIMKGVTINEKTLALDAIKSAGAGGSFLTLKHTLSTYSQEHIQSELLDRTSWGEWERKGKKTLAESAYEKIKNLSKEHKLEPIPEETKEKAKEIIKRFE